MAIEARTYGEGEGVLHSETKCSSACPKCGQQRVTYRIWESSCGGYEDYKYTCHGCGHKWWVDGIDS